MSFKYKIDIIGALKAAGYSTYAIRKENLLNEYTLTKIRKDEIVSVENLEKICKLLHCQPGDILEYVEDSE